MKPSALPLFALLVLLGGADAARAQDAPGDEEPAAVDTTPLRLSGPRLGLTLLTGESARLLDEDFDARPVITQFGWQVERRMFQMEGGLSGVTELVALVGGLEQGLALPSLTFLVGLRTPGGAEIGLGPNASASGFGLAVAAGATRSYGGLNVPVNLSAVLSDEGVRLSLLVGFNVAR